MAILAAIRPNTETSDNVIWLNGRNAEKNESAADVQTQKSKDAEMPVDQWLALRKEEACRINPLTAEVDWSHGQILDPYGVDPNLPPECDCVGRVYFARNPESYIWVCFDDLPQASTRCIVEEAQNEIGRSPRGLIVRWQFVRGDNSNLCLITSAKQGYVRTVLCVTTN